MSSSNKTIYGNLPSDWNCVPLGELISQGKANLQTGPFGTLLQASEYRPTGTPVIAVQNIGDNRINQDKIPRIDDETVSRLAGYKLSLNDILFCRKGYIERRAIIRETEIGWLQGSDCIRLRFDDSIDPKFVSYVLGSPAYLSWILRHAQGATMASLNQEILKLIPLPLPPLPTQHAIARFLGSLDDKIELNRQMNETLEAMARAIFRSWFVDFDPVRAKAEGRDTGLPPEVAALFPSEMVEMDGREVPKGWEDGTLEEIADNIRKPINPDQVDPDTPYIGLEHMPQHSIALSEWGSASNVESGKFQFSKGDFLFGKLRPYFHKVGIAPVDGVCSTDILVINPKKGCWSAYVICCISSDEFVEFANIGSDGTRMPRSSWAAMKTYPIAVPEEGIATVFNTQIQPLFARINANIHESRTLVEIRDALLPKLMSGEISIGDDLMPKVM